MCRESIVKVRNFKLFTTKIDILVQRCLVAVLQDTRLPLPRLELQVAVLNKENEVE